MLVFFDIDGTLIGEKSHIMPESAKRAIQKARENGHICMVNTGRTQKLVAADEAGLTDFDGMIMGCGTMILYHGQILLHRTIGVRQAEQIIGSLRRHRIDACLEGSEDNFCDSDDRIFTDTFKRFKHGFDALGYKSFAEAAGRFDKFLAYVDEPAHMEAFQREFESELDFVDRKGGYFEIMPKGYSKASAMRILAETLGISMDQTAAVGDSGNDISMLACARFGIAMGNAEDEVKAAADYVTTDADGDGIENALRWLGAIA